MKKKVSLLLALGLVCTTVLSGCGGGSTPTEPQTIADATTEAAGSEASTEGAEAADTLADVQEMTFVLNNEPNSIDPTVTSNSFATPFLANCFEGLVTYDEKGEVVPGNAESWESNDDLTQFTFHLRDGLKWSDGSDLTAED